MISPKDNANRNRRIAKNTGFLYIRMFFVLIVSLYTTRIVLEALGVIDYGIFNVVAGFVSMFSFLNTSMSNGIQRFYNYHMGQPEGINLSTVFNTAVQIQLIIAVLILFLIETVGLWYMYHEMVIPSDRFTSALWVFQFSVASLILIILQVPFSSAIIAHEAMSFFAYISIFEVISKLVIAYLLISFSSDKLILYGFLTFIITLIVFLSNYFYTRKKFQEVVFKKCFNVNEFKSMLSFSGWNICGSFAYLLKGQGLNVLLNTFFGPIVNAARGVSTMIMNAIQSFQSNIVLAFRPQLVQSYASNEIARVEHLFFNLSKISYVLLTMLSVPVIIEINYILKIWLGDNVPDYTAIFSVLTLIDMVILSLNTPVSQVVHATGKMRNYQLSTSLIICMILPISYLFLKLGYNPTIVFIICIIFSVINQIVCLIFLKKIFDYNVVKYITEVILPCLSYSILVTFISFTPIIFMDSSFIRLTIVCLICFGVTVASSVTFILNSKEKQLVIEIIRKRIKK